MNCSGPFPYVLINMAMTADGKIATANDSISSFGSRRDLQHLYELRATADAVMSGARTVELNRTKLSPGGRRFEELRVQHGLARFNLRVIVSGSASISTSAPIFQHRFSPIIVIISCRASLRRRRALEEIADEVLVAGEAEIDFASALRHLRRRWNVRRLLGEGGGQVNDGLFRAGLVNEVNLTICPRVFGGRTAPTIVDGRGFPSLAQARDLKLKRAEPIGSELFLVYTVRPHRSSTTS